MIVSFLSFCCLFLEVRFCSGWPSICSSFLWAKIVPWGCRCPCWTQLLFVPVSPPFLFLFHTNRPTAREGVVIRPMGLLGSWFHPRSLTQMPGMDTSFYLALLLVSAINLSYSCSEVCFTHLVLWLWNLSLGFPGLHDLLWTFVPALAFPHSYILPPHSVEPFHAQNEPDYPPPATSSPWPILTGNTKA